MAAARNDTASYLRAKAHMAGVHPDTDLRTACDVMFALEVDGVPGKELKEWRQQMDQQLMKGVTPDRSTWGLLPGQRAATSQLLKAAGASNPPGEGSKPPRGGVKHVSPPA